MDIKVFLLSSKTLNQGELARRMWPGNKSPESYLSGKLSGAREFTLRDAQRALDVLQQLIQELAELTIEQHYPDPLPGPKKKQSAP